jgi:hypothetical protein
LQRQSTLRWQIQAFALLFPLSLSQFVGGAALMLLCPTGRRIGAYLFGARALSFVIAGQVNARARFSKKKGPIMHVPLFLVMPTVVAWALQAHTDAEVWPARFCFFTSAITGVSFVLDSIVAVKWMMGFDVGRYDDIQNKRKQKERVFYEGRKKREN